MDYLTEEIEHMEFLDECAVLVEQIFAAWMDKPLRKLEDGWFDIMVYGNEPIFASMLFDRMESEAQ